MISFGTLHARNQTSDVNTLPPPYRTCIRVTNARGKIGRGKGFMNIDSIFLKKGYKRRGEIFFRKNIKNLNYRLN